MFGIFPFMMVMGEGYSVTMPASLSYFASATGSSAYSGIQIDNDGSIKEYENGSYFVDGSWLDYGVNTGFEVHCVRNSGSTIYGPTLGSWHSLDSDRLWYLLDSTASAATVATANLTISIRKDGVTLDSTSVTLTANRTS